MRRTLPRLFAIALLVISFAFLFAATVSAQEQMAWAAISTAPVLPASLTNSVLFPATFNANAAEAVAPVPPIAQVARYNASKRPLLLPALYASTALLQALDAHSTMTALSVGAHEANPLMKGVASNKGALLAVKAGVAGATIYFAEKMWKRNPVGAIVMMALINGVNAAVVAHNYRVVRSLR